MKTVKHILLASILVCAVGSACADTLYWQVDTSTADAYYTGSDVASAQLYKTTSTERPYEGAIEVGEAAQVVDGKTTSVQLADISSADSAYSFFVELYNASGDAVWTQYATPYDQIMNSGYVSTGISTPTPLATGGMNGAAVPEPTSGVLLLIGGALLALRRRRG